MKSRTGRVVAGFAFIAALALVGACKGDDAVDDKERGKVADAPTTSMAGLVVVHMTGLLLMVPSTKPGEVMNVLIPATASDHEARLVFGLEPSHPDYADLCVDATMVEQYHICHVDLKKWTLERFVAGGDTPPIGAELPDGLLNATHLSGTRYKAVVTPASRRVTFSAGWTGANHCRLANWSYQPVNEGGTKQARQKASTLNVLDWEIPNPTDLRLEFRRPSKVVSVTLPVGNHGITELVLAHVHKDEVKDLPPHRATELKPGQEAHFKAFYDLLEHEEHPGQKPPETTHRPIPEEAKPIAASPCRVAVTTTPAPRASDEANALGTYACMIAMAEGS